MSLAQRLFLSRIRIIQLPYMAIKLKQSQQLVVAYPSRPSSSVRKDCAVYDDCI
jgi:hypothetical protein